MEILFKKDGEPYSEKELLLLILKKLGIIVTESHEVISK